MSSGFRLHQITARQVDAACRVVKLYAARHVRRSLLRGLSREAKPFTRANEKFNLSPACRCDGFIPAEIKIVEGAAR